MSAKKAKKTLSHPCRQSHVCSLPPALPLSLPQGVELVTAGFPCIDVSRAGLRTGLTGRSTGLVRVGEGVGEFGRHLFFFSFSLAARAFFLLSLALTLAPLAHPR